MPSDADTRLVARAHALAARIHRNHVRGNLADDPLLDHLEEVERLVATAGGSAKERAAALLHDSVEVAGYKLRNIRRYFGKEIAGIVAEVSDPPEWKDLPTLERKRLQAAKLGGASESARLIKLADCVSFALSSARDPYTRKNRDDIRERLQGCREIVERFKKVSPPLVRQFFDAYRMASKVHGSLARCA